MGFSAIVLYLCAQHLKGVLKNFKNSTAEIIPNEPGRVMPLREKKETPVILIFQYFRGFLFKSIFNQE